MAEIISAINEHKYLEFEYEGYPRKVIPFAYGNHVETGNKVMRALQVAGGSKSGKFDFPKLWTVEEMSLLRVLDEKFTIPDQYQTGDKHINPIEAQL